MECPVDGTTLLITHREGIEIDYCPQCRGVWLDRGELDKLIEREADRDLPPKRDSAPRVDSDPAYKRKNDDDYYPDERHPGERHPGERYPDERRPQGKRRGSFLEDIFDIFD